MRCGLAKDRILYEDAYPINSNLSYNSIVAEIVETDIERAKANTDLHDHFQEIFIVINSCVEIGLGEYNLFTLKTGESLEIPAGVKHWTRKLGRETARVIIISVPISGYHFKYNVKTP